VKFYRDINLIESISLEVIIIQEDAGNNYCSAFSDSVVEVSAGVGKFPSVSKQFI
jgi:hypothetical protein